MEHDSSTGYNRELNVEQELFELYQSFDTDSDKIKLMHGILVDGYEKTYSFYKNTNDPDRNMIKDISLLGNFVDLEYGTAVMVLYDDKLIIASNRKKIINMCSKYLISQGNVIIRIVPGDTSTLYGSKYKRKDLYRLYGFKYSITYKFIGSTLPISLS